ncbi:MAG: hypothetical protein PHD74_05240 [Candidatus Krumholzibacteria bacterium]|nr:hypothetical protein [Candidatus Krumholzibacteria bacterium]
MRTRIHAVLAAALLICVWGCQNASIVPTPDTSSQEINLNDPTGGLTTANERPAFGEPDKFAALTDESCIEDQYEKDPDYRDDTLIARGARLYDFRAIWGYLAALGDTDSSDPCPLDWSGSLHFEGGIIVMEKAIAFEADDSIERIDSSTVQWTSHTGPSIDGIQVKLVVPPLADSLDSNGTTPQLVMAAGPFSRTFTLDELAALSLVSSVDTCGNAISITSVFAPPACPHGQLMGNWEETIADSLTPSDTLETDSTVEGIFRGVWIARHGLISGYLKGVYGLNDDGENVFFGKYIDADGNFLGIVRGIFGSRSAHELCGDGNGHGRRHGNHPLGWFSGEWIDKNSDVQGRLRGHWNAAEDGNGCFNGIWGMRCSEGAEGDIGRCKDIDN